jgi:NAD+ kinase
MKSLERIGLFANVDILGVETALRSALEIIENAGAQVVIETDLKAMLGSDLHSCDRGTMGENVDLVLVFGGDGTFLRAAREIDGARVPLLGINMGSLGFLTVLKLSEIGILLPKVLEGDYRIQERMMLRARHLRANVQLGSYRALNDVVLHMSPGNRLVEIILSLSGEYMGRYRADGLIISTPTGSTAYSMSAGGPVVYPGMEALVATPICPHSFSLRPVVVGSDKQFEILIGERSGMAALSLDGQDGAEVQPGDIIEIRKSGKVLPLLLPPGIRFTTLLQEKLGWGSMGEVGTP